jgi:hypothetical protein
MLYAQFMPVHMLVLALHLCDASFNCYKHLNPVLVSLLAFDFYLSFASLLNQPNHVATANYKQEWR